MDYTPETLLALKDRYHNSGLWAELDKHAGAWMTEEIELLSALRAIADTKTSADTNHAQLSALLIAIAKTAIQKARG